MDNLRLWHKFLETIKSQVSPANFKAWFLKTSLKDKANGSITLSAPNAFIKETLNQRHLPLISETFAKILKEKVRVELIVQEKDEEPKEPEEDFFQPVQAPNLQLNPKYTLENFVVGPSNNVAFAAACAVVQNPGTAYNPLFIYGGTGVGKTHLMLGIGNAIAKKKSSAKINYCSSEKFTNDYVEAIQTRRMAIFRKKYRAADTLLIDDIQFFSGREGTQEEFFHTFNELQARNSQMVITSDRSPREIAKLEDRLRSRFAGGLMVDMQVPDFDTRVAILKAKCHEWGAVFEENSLKLIAAQTEESIRELEGKLLQIIQLLKAQNLKLSPENVARYLSKPAKIAPALTYQQVILTVCKYFNISSGELIGPKRQKELVLPRHVCMYILSKDLGMTVEKTGQVLGGRDHTTVMHGRDKIEQLISVDREVQRIFTEVKQQLIS